MKVCDVCETGAPTEWSFGKYKRCDAHDVCEECGTARKDLTEIPWGTRLGIRCKPCDEKRKAQAVADYAEKGLDDSDHECTDQPICPNCGDECTDEEGHWIDVEDKQVKCGNCDLVFLVSSSVSVTYSTKKVGVK